MFSNANDKAANLITRGQLRWLWLVVFVFLIDQGTKFLAVTFLPPYSQVHILSFLNFVLTFNEGAAFSFLSNAAGWQRWFFVCIAIIVGGLIVLWLFRMPRKFQLAAASLALILGGDFGNLSDRIFRGHVVDFLDFYVWGWHWPAFNIADSSICIGTFLLLICLARGRYW